MDFLTTEVTTYKTGCLVNFLPCMAIYICSRPGTLWSDSLTSLPCLWSILRDWMQNRPTLTVWQHIVLWQRGPLSQPACCQAKSYPHKTHPVIYQWYSTYINQQHLHVIPNSLFWSWCQRFVFVWKRCSLGLIQYKKSRHMAGNSHYADIRIDL